MPTTRRTNGLAAGSPSTPSSPKDEPSANSKAIDPSAIIPPPTHSAYLPTRTEAVLLAIYPLTLLFGSLFSHFSPSLRPPSNTSIYSEIHQSFQPPSAAPSYFAQKRNIFNVYFVKIGWFWCTLAVAAFAGFVAQGRSSFVAENESNAATLRPTTRAEPAADVLLRRDADARLRRQFQLVARYLAATAFWIATTQWCFGPALVDRGFALTGGVCEVAKERLVELEGSADAIAQREVEIARLVSHTACRVAGGTWKGGYDISGHVFILVLGSGMLWLEMLPFLLPRIKGLGLGRVVRTGEGRECRVIHELIRLGQSFTVGDFDGSGGMQKGKKNDSALKEFATTLALGVVVLCWWMLLMTAAFFHTWFEKLTGCIWAFLALWVVYFLPRGQPMLRSIVGMPGI